MEQEDISPVILPVLYQDEHYIVIDKPSALLVHRSEMSTDTESALKILRNQINQKVYPVHRLDRATSGINIFALAPESLKLLSQEFENRRVQKIYHAIVRGYTKEHEIIDYQLKNDDTGIIQDAVSEYRLINKVELPIPLGKHSTSRYSLVEVKPLTGRKHQIRKHFHHISHHIIGDTTYGEGKHNRLFRDKFGLNRLLLMATKISFTHPYTNEQITVKCKLSEEVSELFKIFEWDTDI